MPTRNIELFLAVLTSVLLFSCTNKTEPEKGPDSGVIINGAVTDICGNRYKVITIGGQTWMAENMSCDTYDTQSEKAGEKIVTVAEAAAGTPSRYMYVKADDKSLWDESVCDADLSNEQIAKLGYLYSRTSALGIRFYDGEVAIDPLTGKEKQYNYSEPINPNTPRQGICPNGWHIPNNHEWATLNNYSNQRTSISSTNNGAGKLLKSKTGWCTNSEDYKAGIDMYAFNALPAGVFYGNKISGVGIKAYWISNNSVSTLPSPPYQPIYAHWCESAFNYSDDINLNAPNINFITEGVYASVRCIKDGSLAFIANIKENRYYEVKNATEIKIEVYTNYLCTAEADTEWVKCETIIGPDLHLNSPYNTLVVLSVDANKTGVDDIAHVTFKAADTTVTIISIHRLPVY